MKCKICNKQTQKIFNTKVLNKYIISYYQCNQCFFLQTEEPYWLEEAYSCGAISALDTGILKRNASLVSKTSELVETIFDENISFRGLDYGGGEGIFVRMMRDKGFNFILHDKYAKNLYAKYFDLQSTDQTDNFSIVTAFEVFEHLPDPLTEIDKIFSYSDIILFSTELIPRTSSDDLKDWWYIVPETGQHISFYHKETLKCIAKKNGPILYSNGYNLHILSKKKLKHNPFQGKSENLISRIKNAFSNKKGKDRISMTQKDFDFVQSRLKNKD